MTRAPPTRLLIALLAGLGSRESVAGGPASPSPAARAIAVRPEVVYARSPVTLAVKPGGGLPPGTRLEWVADRGLLLFDDLEEVVWRAPAEGGAARISLTLHLPAKPVERIETVIDVRSPSTGGMVWVPAGRYTRGDVRGTRDLEEVKTVQNASDEPFHEVDLDGFWIDRHPVTNAEYALYLSEALRQGMVRVADVAVMGELDGSWVPFYYFKPYTILVPGYYETGNPRKPEFLHWISFDGSGFRIEKGKERYPVVDVSWFGAAAYARFHGRSLPTEAQWEKAARGPDGRRFPWGNNLPTPYHANSAGSYEGELAPAGRYSPIGDSPYGVADMLSGAVEWVNDWFQPRYYEDYRAETPLRNPPGPFWGRSHAIRGAPFSLRFPNVAEIDPLGFRYSWRFEFLVGDIFANRATTFRTALVPVRRGNDS
jgi:formylglycine-generating enzyme required for sulfatase activity